MPLGDNSYTKKKFDDFLAEVLLLMVLFYFAQGTFYASGSVISQACLLILLLISLFYYLKTLFINAKHNLFYYSWSLLLWINVIGFITTGDFSDEMQTSMFKNILGCILPFYPFYFFSIKHGLKSSIFVRFVILLLIFSILQFYLNRNQLIQTGIFDEQSVVNNIAYYFVVSMPFIFMVKNKTLSGLLMGLIVIFIIQGAKRGALLAGAVGLILYFYFQITQLEKKHWLKNIILAIIIIIALGAFSYLVFISNEFIISRIISITEGAMSDRDIIYRTLFNKWYNSESIVNFIFGFGFAKSLTIAGNYAHNDWLELLSNFGILGIILYILLFYSALKNCLDRQWNRNDRLLMLTIVTIWFSISMVSMWYSSLIMVTQSILLGYLIGTKSRDTNNELVNPDENSLFY